MAETNQMDTPALWADHIDYREAERVYVVPSMFGERPQMIARLGTGIRDLLGNEIKKGRARTFLLKPWQNDVGAKHT